MVELVDTAVLEAAAESVGVRVSLSAPFKDDLFMRERKRIKIPELFVPPDKLTEEQKKEIRIRINGDLVIDVRNRNEDSFDRSDS